MNALAEDLGKYCLLVLLLMPFLALFTDVVGKTNGIMLKVAAGVVAVSWLVIWLVGGFEPRPNVANVFVLAWLAWPLALLVAKGWNSELPWGSLWVSVLLMGWYHVMMAVLFHGEGGLGAGMALLLGWSYMIIPFAVLSLAFLTGREVVRIIVKIRSGRVRGIAFRERMR